MMVFISVVSLWVKLKYYKVTQSSIDEVQRRNCLFRFAAELLVCQASLYFRHMTRGDEISNSMEFHWSIAMFTSLNFLEWIETTFIFKTNFPPPARRLLLWKKGGKATLCLASQLTNCKQSTYFIICLSKKKKRKSGQTSDSSAQKQ